MTEEDAIDARRIQVKVTLETLRLRSFMNENDISDVSISLKNLVEHINVLAPQCPSDFCSDAHKTDYLRKSVTEFNERSQVPIQSTTAQKYTFAKFVTSLH